MKLSYGSMILGAIALFGAVFHFWAGPIAPQKSVETTVGESVVEIKDAALRKMRGEEPPPPERRNWDADDTATLAIAGLGALAIILAMVGFVRHERKRPVIAGVALGVSALTFQFVVWFAVMLIFVLLIAVVIENFGDFIGG